MIILIIFLFALVAQSHEEDDESKEKLAAELVYKNNELKNLMMQYTELKKIAKNG